MKGSIVSISDAEEIMKVINEAAQKYKGVVPEDCLSEPYMDEGELREEMGKMDFYGFTGEKLRGVVGVQNLDEVTMIRHLYVLPDFQDRGIGTRLLEHAIEKARNDTILIGAWKRASWAVDFYENRGFEKVENVEELLGRYWDVPERQIEESVVLEYKG